MDVDGLHDDARGRLPPAVGWNGEDDDDVFWADEEPDDNDRDWIIKNIME